MVANANGCLAAESSNFPFNVPWAKEKRDAIQLRQRTSRFFLITVVVGSEYMYDFFRTKINLGLFLRHFDRRRFFRISCFMTVYFYRVLEEQSIKDVASYLEVVL